MMIFYEFRVRRSHKFVLSSLVRFSYGACQSVFLVRGFMIVMIVILLLEGTWENFYRLKGFFYNDWMSGLVAAGPFGAFGYRSVSHLYCSIHLNRSRTVRELTWIFHHNPCHVDYITGVCHLGVSPCSLLFYVVSHWNAVAIDCTRCTFCYNVQGKPILFLCYPFYSLYGGIYIHMAFDIHFCVTSKLVALFMTSNLNT